MKKTILRWFVREILMEILGLVDEYSRVRYTYRATDAGELKKVPVAGRMR